MEVVAIFKQLLSKAYPTLGYHVLPEAKEYDEHGSVTVQLIETYPIGDIPILLESYSLINHNL